MASDRHEGHKKIQCWIPLTMWEQIESAGYSSPTHAVMKAFELLLDNPAQDFRESHNATNNENAGYSENSAGYSEIPELRARIEEKDKQIDEKDRHIETLKAELEKAAQREASDKRTHDNYMAQMQTLIQQKAIEAPGAKKPWWRLW